MKILVVIPAVGLEYGGPSMSVLDLVKWCGREANAQIDIVTTNANGTTKLDVELNVWIEEESYRIKYFAFTPVSDYKLSADLTKWLFAHVKDYDVVHTNAIFSYPVVAAWWACRVRGVPYIITPHGMLEPWALRHKNHKKIFHYNLIDKPALQNASAVQVLNRTEAGHVRALGIETPCVCVPNGIHQQDFEKLPDAEIFYSAFPETRGKRLILFLGRIDPKKGLDLLAPAFAEVRKRFADAHLIVAGPDNIGFLPTVREFFEQVNCTPAITVTGMLTGDLKAAAFAASEVYILPSYSEGFSVSVLESMAAGLPCVITRGCNFPEASEAGVAHVVETTVTEIAEALVKCFAAPHEAAEMGSRARMFVMTDYAWEPVAAKLVNVYRAIKEKSSLAEFGC